MTDGNVNKEIVLAEWDCHADKVKKATTIEQLAPSLAFFFMALRPFIERETVLEQECAARMAGCPARAILRGDLKAGKTAIVQLVKDCSPWLLLVGYLVWRLIRAKAL